MQKAGFRQLVSILIFFLIPLCANAVIEEKSSIIGSLLTGSSEPVSGVTVRLLDSFFLNEVAQTVTDPKGKFTLSNIVPGLYLISIQSTRKPDVLKRVQVVSGSPTLIDIRPLLTEDELKQHNAWETFKWTIRIAQRNPLRDEEYAGEANLTALATDGFWGTLKALQEQHNIDGEFSYLNVGIGPFRSRNSNNFHQTAQFAMQGQLEGSGKWSVNGNVLDGIRSSYTAAGDFEYRLLGHQLGASFSANDLLFARFPELLERQRITRFIQSADPAGIVDESNRWVTSIDLEDEWHFRNRFTVNYGTRFDYYGYLQNPGSYSPRLKLAYQLKPGLFLHGLLYRNESAPGNYYLQPGQIHPYIHDIAFVPYGGTLLPETKRGFETGLDYAMDHFSVSLLYHSDNIQNKIAAIDFRNSPGNDQLQTILPFVLLNAADLESRGVEVQVSKKISHVISAKGSYNITSSIPIYIIEKRAFSQRQMFFLSGRDPQDFHDIQAGIEANIQQSLTQVQANWKWSSGGPLVFGRKDDNTSLSAVDIEVHQGIPVQFFNQSQLKVLLAIRNLLDQNDQKSGNADYQRALLFDSPRVIAGGVLLEF
jgi:outer membrane receptor protein involved in Fe transport